MGDQTRLVADVGGTNTRLAVYDPEHDEFRHVARFTNSEYASLAAVIDSWRGALNEALPTTACLAIAASTSNSATSSQSLSSIARWASIALLIRVLEHSRKSMALSKSLDSGDLNNDNIVRCSS